MAPRFLLLPGMDGTGQLFERFQAHARAEVSVVRYPRDVPLDYPALVERVAADLPREPFIALGESFSGPIALALAARGVPGLAGVVLSASFVAAPLPRALRHAPWSLAFGVSPPLALLRHLLCGGDLELARTLRTVMRGVAPEVLAARARAALGCDARPALAAAGVDILYLQAAGDRLVPPRCGAAIAALSPRATLARVPGPHLLLQANPRAAWEAIARWWAPRVDVAA